MGQPSSPCCNVVSTFGDRSRDVDILRVFASHGQPHLRSGYKILLPRAGCSMSAFPSNHHHLYSSSRRGRCTPHLLPPLPQVHSPALICIMFIQGSSTLPTASRFMGMLRWVRRTRLRSVSSSSADSVTVSSITITLYVPLSL